MRDSAITTVFILGRRYSGKSTVFKHVRVLFEHHQRYYEDSDELERAKNRIVYRTLEAMQALVGAMDTLDNGGCNEENKRVAMQARTGATDTLYGSSRLQFNDWDPHEYVLKANWRRIRSLEVDFLLRIIDELWRGHHSIFREALLLEHRFRKHRSVEHLLDVLGDKIRKGDYVPTTRDILLTREDTRGVSHLIIDLDSKHLDDSRAQRHHPLNRALKKKNGVKRYCQMIDLPDSGTSINIKHWIEKCSDLRYYIIFCVDLSGYDPCLKGDHCDCVKESLTAFEGCSQPLIRRSS